MTKKISLLALVFVFGLSSCAPDGATVDEAQYAAKIVGDWQGTVADVNETISFSADGRFMSRVRRRGFISNTLGQGTTDTMKTVISLASIQVAKESMILHAMLLEERFRTPMITNTSPSLFTLAQRNDIAALQGEGGLHLWVDQGRRPRRGFAREISKLNTKSPMHQKRSKFFSRPRLSARAPMHIRMGQRA
jgi:hypothetical protein